MYPSTRRCTSIQEGLRASISWYSGYLKGLLGGAGVAPFSKTLRTRMLKFVWPKDRLIRGRVGLFWAMGLAVLSHRSG